MKTDELEKIGVQEVQKRLAENIYGDPRNPNYISVQAWLHSKELEGATSREEETLSVAREANDLARSSNAIASEAKEFARLASDSASKQARWAKIAAIIAAIAAIISSITTIIMALLMKN